MWSSKWHWPLSKTNEDMQLNHQPNSNPCWWGKTMANAIVWTKKASYVSLSDENALKQFESVGQNKGLVFSFKEGEIITFPSAEDACVSPKSWKDKSGKTQRSLNCMAHSDLRGQFDFPIAALRRVPIEEDRARLFGDDNTMGESLAQSNLSDLERYRSLLGKTIRVSEVLKLRTPEFEWSAEKGWEVIPDKFGSITCFKFEVVE